MPTLLAALPPQFKQLHARSSCTLATVRYTCVQKGGGSMCALQGARRTGAFERPEADEVCSAGARSPSSARTPFAVTGGHLALSSEGLSGAHHADKTNFSGGGSPQDFLAQCNALKQKRVPPHASSTVFAHADSTALRNSLYSRGEMAGRWRNLQLSCGRPTT